MCFLGFSGAPGTPGVAGFLIFILSTAPLPAAAADGCVPAVVEDDDAVEEVDAGDAGSESAILPTPGAMPSRKPALAAPSPVGVALTTGGGAVGGAPSCGAGAAATAGGTAGAVGGATGAEDAIWPLGG